MPARILVLDPEPVVRSVISEILKRAGYIVLPAASLGVATRIVKNAPPDLVITNVYLPGITGQKAVRLLKSVCPTLLVLVMVSGSARVELIKEWAGQDGFETFPKPFTAEGLLAKVREMVP